MLAVETVARIRRAHLVQGKSIKAISRELGLSRNAVRKVLRSGETSFVYEREVQPRPKLGPWAEELERQLMANDRLSRREWLGLIRVILLGFRGSPALCVEAFRRFHLLSV